MDLVYSVIIPVYNAEKYLEDCVQSVLDQTSASAFEIILVNDGSRDSSAAICDRYATQDARIQVIHQVNQGVSVARNAGIAAAKGQYVLFLDSDDLWSENLLTSVDAYISRQPDMIEYGCCYFGREGDKKATLSSCIADGGSGEAYLQQHEKLGIMPVVSACMVAFCRGFLVEHQLTFPLDISYGEDFHFCMHSLKCAKSVYAINEILYRVRINEESVTHTPNVKKIRDVLSVCADMYRLFPGKLLADYYCMSIWAIEGLRRDDAQRVYDLLQENRDILKQVSGGRARLARTMYKLFGWYNGAKLLRTMVNIRNSIRK